MDYSPAPPSKSLTPTLSNPEATKAANRKAEALGVDLSQVRGSGVGGRITIKDVVGAAS